jgi:hypothetical protein
MQLLQVQNKSDLLVTLKRQGVQMALRGKRIQVHKNCRLGSGNSIFVRLFQSNSKCLVVNRLLFLSGEARIAIKPQMLGAFPAPNSQGFIH